MHSNHNLKKCFYYKSKTHCPFEKLGCAHGISIKFKDNEANEKDTSEKVNEMDTDEYFGERFRTNIETAFCTSTPMKSQRKLIKYEDCLDISEQCTASKIIQKIEDKHAYPHVGTFDDNEEDKDTFV